LYGYPRKSKVTFYVNDGLESAMFNETRPGYARFLQIVSKRFKKPVSIIRLKTSHDDGSYNTEVVTEANYDNCMSTACQRAAGFVIEG